MHMNDSRLYILFNVLNAWIRFCLILLYRDTITSYSSTLLLHFICLSSLVFILFLFFSISFYPILITKICYFFFLCSITFLPFLDRQQEIKWNSRRTVKRGSNREKKSNEKRISFFSTTTFHYPMYILTRMSRFENIFRYTILPHNRTCEWNNDIEERERESNTFFRLFESKTKRLMTNWRSKNRKKLTKTATSNNVDSKSTLRKNANSFLFTLRPVFWNIGEDEEEEKEKRNDRETSRSAHKIRNFFTWTWEKLYSKINRERFKLRNENGFEPFLLPPFSVTAFKRKFIVFLVVEYSFL